MKLAEALILRADCQKRIGQLRSRLTQYARVQEGDVAPEVPQDLIAEVEQALNELRDLIKRINRTNSEASFSGERTVTDALADRDVHCSFVFVAAK